MNMPNPPPPAADAARPAAALGKALIVGGGIGGMSAAISLRRRGFEVDLIDIDPEWRVYGTGITITGPTLRALQALGVLDAVRAHAYTGDGIQICTPQGEPVRQLPTPVVGDPGLPGSGGIMRPLLHSLLSAATREAGAVVRLGLTVDRLEDGADNGPDALDVHFSDGSRGRYGFAVGADGVFSRVRDLVFPQAPQPQYTGQCVWRLVVPRPPEIDRRHFFLGGPVKIGLSPVSRDEMYLFLLETTPRRPRVDDSRLHAELARLMAGYGGVLGRIRDALNPASRIVLRPLEGFLLPRPWHRGRVLLIGDAAHPTTPQLASGAGMAMEDGLVLAEEAAGAATVAALFDGFMARRYERCRLVVENSLEIGRREQTGASAESQAALVEQSLRLLAEPI